MPSYSSSRCVPVFPQGPHGSVERLVLPGPGAVPGACPSLIMAPGSCESTPRRIRPNAAAASRSPYEGGSCRPEFLAADLDVLQRLARGEPPRVLAPPCTADQLIRYRWWVGHQAAFGLWRVLAETLTAITQSPSPSPASLAAAARMFDCSTLLYLYTGSCTTAQYNQQLRPAMRDCHPAFSGEWARDFTPLPALVQKARHEFPGELTASLMEASRRSVRVHMAVADELVPEASPSSRPPDTDPVANLHATCRPSTTPSSSSTGTGCAARASRCNSYDA